MHNNHSSIDNHMYYKDKGQELLKATKNRKLRKTIIAHVLRGTRHIETERDTYTKVKTHTYTQKYIHSHTHRYQYTYRQRKRHFHNFLITNQDYYSPCV